MSLGGGLFIIAALGIAAYACLRALIRGVIDNAERCCASHYLDGGCAAGTKLVGGVGRKGVPAACDIARHKKAPSA